MVQEQLRLGKWVRSVHDRLRGARDIYDLRRSQAERDRQSRIAWDAIMGLDRLHRNMRIHKEPARNRGASCASPARSWACLRSPGSPCSGMATWCSKASGSSLHGTAASSPITWPIRSSGIRPGHVLINEPRESSWGARFPQIQNLLAVPVADKTKLSGWVLAFNKRQVASRGPNDREHRPAPAAEHGESGQSPILPFRRLDAAILMPFASLLGLHVRASQRYLYINDVLVGLTRSLTAAIDAKDEYTYGHSERVARAAVELGRELGLHEAEQNGIVPGWPPARHR